MDLKCQITRTSDLTTETLVWIKIHELKKPVKKHKDETAWL